MVARQLTCLIAVIAVGETPITQFLSWRLSLGNSFLILVSQYVPSDGLVGWKSSRLGANFYTPNIFIKDVKDLSSKLIDKAEGACKYSIDVAILAGISIDAIKVVCGELSRVVTKRTTVLISADFGCELEVIASESFGRNCNCIISIACDVECRQLSLGSYALVNDDHCTISLGTTYASKNYQDNLILLENKLNAQEELKNENSNANKLLRQLLTTSWIKVVKFTSTESMAVNVWNNIIPKISLNILSIIYEQFDYDQMLLDKNIETMFKDLVRELFEICVAQCNAGVYEHALPSKIGSEKINFRSIVDHCKRKKLALINSTAHEYPEYLSLPFEPYCFYHRFEYPAQILLYQPILLAQKYKVVCSNLNFLYGFYSRLLSLSGLSIKGGRIERHTTHFDHLMTTSPVAENEEAQEKNNAQKNVPGMASDLSIALHKGAFQAIPDDVGTTDFNRFELQPSTRMLNIEGRCVAGNGKDSTNEAGETDGLLSKSKFSTYQNNLCQRNQRNNEMGIQESNFSFDRTQSPTTPQSVIDDMGIVSMPQLDNRNSQYSFEKSYLSWLREQNRIQESSSSTKSLIRPYTTTGVELQLRRGHNLIVREYQNLQNKLYNLESPLSKELYDGRRLKYAHMEKELWRFQRRLSVYNGKIPRANTGPYEDLLEHLDVLTQKNPTDISRCTTGRYSEVDFYTSIQTDREQLYRSIERKSKSVSSLRTKKEQK